MKGSLDVMKAKFMTSYEGKREADFLLAVCFGTFPERVIHEEAFFPSVSNLIGAD